MSFRCLIGIHDAEPAGKSSAGNPRKRCQRCGDIQLFDNIDGSWTYWYPQRWWDRDKRRIEENRALVDSWPDQ